MNPHDRDMLARLAEDPVWQALREDVRDQKQRVFVSLAHKLIAQGKNIDAGTVEREVLLATGFFQGMETLLRRPGISAKQIERELAKEEPSGEEG